MARTPIGEAGELKVAEVIHKSFSALPADVTVAELRDWFAASSHRRMAFLADRGLYAGSISRDDLDACSDPAGSARDLACSGPIVAPGAAASTAYELAITSDARRVAVVDDDGTLIGVVAVTDDLAAFCGTT